MGVYNPLRLRMNAKGEMVDKYGRIMYFSEEKLKKARRPLNRGGRVWKAYHAHKYSGSHH